MLARIRLDRRLRLGALGMFIWAVVSLVAAGSIGASSSGAEAEAGFSGGSPGDLDVPGVLHLQAQHVWYGPAGQEVSRRQSELWLDPHTNSARLEHRGASGKPDVTTVREGLRLATFMVDGKSAIVQVAADGSALYLNAVRDQVFAFKALLDAGRAQVLGEESFAGVVTTKIRTPAVLDSDSGLTRYEVNLDKQSGLLLRQSAFQVDPANPSGVQLMGTELIQYSQVEHIDQALLPTDTFSTAIPAGWNYSSYTALTPGTANALHAFDMYWLGSSFGGLPLFGMSHDEAQRGTTHINSVNVTYANPFVNGVRAPGQVSLIERPPLGPGEMPTPGMPVPAGTAPRSVTVAGRAATLFQGGGPVRLEMTIGGTFITIHGTDESQVLQAAGSLQKLN